MPLVSVNITTYNRAHLLQRCLNSVFKQTYSNIEVIIVDDHSNDNTEQVIADYKEIHSRIRYFCHKKNFGLSFSRNTGVKASIGKYIAFMDDDDEWIDRNKLQKQVALFENPAHVNLGIVCSSVNLIRSDKMIPNIITRPAHLKRMILKGNGYIYSPTVMTKRAIILAADGFDTNLQRGIDSDFYRKCILQYNYRVHFMPEITTNIYETGSDRITGLTSKQALIKHIYANRYCVKKYIKYFLKYPSTLLYRFLRISKAVFLLLCYRFKSN